MVGKINFVEEVGFDPGRERVAEFKFVGMFPWHVKPITRS